MTLAVLIPYRPDTPHRERIYEVTAKLWAKTGYEVIHCDDGLTGLFSYARAANRARAKTTADYLLTYSVDALPLSVEALQRLEVTLAERPWAAVFSGQRRFTEAQTAAILDGAEPGDPEGEIAWGREALLGIRADVFDDLRGYDERFVGWGPEDVAFHLVLKALYPEGRDEPTEGLFSSLWHPPVSREALPALMALWRTYLRTPASRMRDWYLSREA